MGRTELRPDRRLAEAILRQEFDETQPRPPEQEIFLAALAATNDAELAMILDRNCGPDAELRRRVERLLAAYADAASQSSEREPTSGLSPDVADFLLNLPPDCAAPDRTSSPLETQGAVIDGKYQLKELVGEGGMGSVWLAEQVAPIRRTVAVKVIKPGLDSRKVLARFEAERQALALMDHPLIAKVLDAGTTDYGRPYFAMDLVSGKPLTRYCDDNQLSIPERLALFVQVCEAVQHAHQKGIIHRDLKPSNILVASHNGKPVPKVIDFGLAKALSDGTLAEQTDFTAFGAMVGTPLYMAPEQADSSGSPADTRTDIYALGVILYELLSGTTPLEDSRLRAAAFDEVRRLIREFEPPKPSTRLSSIDALPSIAALRRIEPARLSKLVRGDLDWIVMRCLEKDQSRRYATANGLARDVERYLANEPVDASPPSATYRLLKFARRNRVILTTSGLVAAALLLGSAISVWQAIEANRSRRLADERLLLTRQAVDDMYTQVAEQWLNNEPNLQPLQREFLLKALAYYEGFAREESNDREAKRQQALALRRVGNIELKLGNRKQAETPLRQALGIFESLAADAGNQPDDRREIVICLQSLTKLFDALGKRDELDQAVRRSVKLAESLSVEFPQERAYRQLWAECLVHEGGLLYQTERPTDAQAVLLKARAELDRLVAQSPDDHTIRTIMLGCSINHYLALFRQPRAPEAEALLEKSLVHAEWLLSRFANDPEIRSIVAGVYRAQADVLSTTGREAESLAPYAKAASHEEWLADRYDDLPSFRFDAACTLLNMGHTCLDLRRVDEGEKLVLQSLQHFEKLWKAHADNPRYIELPLRELARAFNWIGTYRAEDGDLTRAEAALGESINYWRRLAGDEPTDPTHRHLLAGVYRQLGEVKRCTGRHADAVSAFRRATALDQADWIALSLLAVTLATAPDAQLRDPPEAVSLARRAVELAANEELPRNALGYAYHAAGENESARASLERAIELHRNGGTFETCLCLARVCWQLGEKDKARDWFNKSLARMDKGPKENAELRRFRAEAAALLELGEIR